MNKYFLITITYMTFATTSLIEAQTPKKPVEESPTTKVTKVQKEAEGSQKSQTSEKTQYGSQVLAHKKLDAYQKANAQSIEASSVVI